MNVLFFITKLYLYRANIWKILTHPPKKKCSPILLYWLSLTSSPFAYIIYMCGEQRMRYICVKCADVVAVRECWNFDSGGEIAKRVFGARCEWLFDVVEQMAFHNINTIQHSIRIHERVYSVVSLILTCHPRLQFVRCAIWNRFGFLFFVRPRLGYGGGVHSLVIKAVEL